MTSRDEGLTSNRALWDEWTDIHETSEFYDLSLRATKTGA